MHREIRPTVARATQLLMLVWMAPAIAQAMASFDLPSQPLADSLRAVGSQTDTNVLFDPPLVSKHQAPALKATLTIDQALSRLLLGTNIKHEFLNEKTVVLSSNLPRVAALSPQAVIDSGADTDSNGSGRDPAQSYAGGLHLAQIPQSTMSDASATEPTAQRGELEEIVVTATKRTESLSKVPISISAYSREALEASGVKSVQDLAALTPGVEFDNSSGFGPGTLTNIAIRGINSSVGTSTTGIYFDDTPIQSRITGLSYFGNPMPLMFDIDRVEVDRGPQGTLFGAGAEGGALRFISPDPDLKEYSGFSRSEGAYTQDGAPSYEAGLAGGGPLIEDKLGFRASAWYRHDGGYVDHIDPLTGATIEANSNYASSYAVRGAFAAAPTDGLKATLSVYDQSVQTHDSSVYFEYLSNPDQGKFKNGRLLQQPFSDKLLLPSLKIEADLGFASLTSITSIVNRVGRLLDDNTSYTASTFPIGYGSALGQEFPTSYSDAAPTRLVHSLNQVSQEVRLASTDSKAVLRWTAGLYFSNTRQFDGESVETPFYDVNFFGVPADTPFLDTSLTSKDKQYAAFAQVDYRVIDPLTVTVGVRVARTDAAFLEYQSRLVASQQFPFASGDQKETPITPKAGLSYQIADDHMLYVSAGKGYRVGGGNLPIPLSTQPAGCPLTQEQGSYKSDSVWSYEIGAKDRFLNGRLRLDLSAYHTDWGKIQQQVFFPTCGFGYTANTGKASINGFDLGFEVLPIDQLTLGLSAAFTDAHFTEDVAVGGNVLVNSGDVIGNPPNVASPWNLTGSARYEWPLPAGQRASVRVEDIFHSRNTGPFTSFDPAAISYEPQIPSNPSTNVLNARVGMVWSSVDVSLFFDNALNRHSALDRFQDGPAGVLFTDSTLRPRTIGVTATHKF